MKDQVYNIKSPIPPAIINLPNKSFIVPIWLEVPKGTTLDQIKWEKETVKAKSNSNIIEVTSSSGEGKYQIQKIGHTYKCNCPGYWRSKDRICKHIKQLIN
jgi:hypothetical protein